MTARKGAAAFVKSADTRSSVVNSKTEVDRLLKRYGATAIQTSEDIAARRITLSFAVPNTGEQGAPVVPVQLRISVHAVYHALYGRPEKWEWSGDGKRRSVFDPKGYNAAKLDQAERVAWRNIVLWLDAALSSAAISLQSITETFFAQTVVGDRGERMIELVEQAQSQLGSGVQRLLSMPADTEGA